MSVLASHPVLTAEWDRNRVRSGTPKAAEIFGEISDVAACTLALTLGGHVRATLFMWGATN